MAGQPTVSTGEAKQWESFVSSPQPWDTPTSNSRQNSSSLPGAGGRMLFPSGRDSGSLPSSTGLFTATAAATPPSSATAGQCAQQLGGQHQQSREQHLPSSSAPRHSAAPGASRRENQQGVVPLSSVQMRAPSTDNTMSLLPDVGRGPPPLSGYVQLQSSAASISSGGYSDTFASQRSTLDAGAKLAHSYVLPGAGAGQQAGRGVSAPSVPPRIHTVNLAQAAINGVGSRAGGGGGAAAAVQRGDNGANGDVHDDFDDGEAAARQDFETLSSQAAMYRKQPVELSVWEALISDLEGLAGKCRAGGRTDEEVHNLLEEIRKHITSEAFLRESRLRTCARQMDEVVTKVEDGELSEMKVSDYDEMIEKVGRLQTEVDELTAQGAGGEGDLDSSLLIDSHQLMDTLRGMKMSVASNQLFLDEQAYAERLKAQYVVLTSPNNGDCLFYSAAFATIALDFLKKNRSTLGSPQATVEDLEAALAKHTDEEIAQQAMRLRAEAVQCLREGGEKYAGMIKEALSAAISGDAMDRTTVMLREGMGAKYGVEDVDSLEGREALKQHIGDASAKEVYLDVMSTPGIFGEKPEIEALSSVMGRKVQVFYYHGEKVDSKGQHLPAEVFEAHGVKGTRPVNLLHSVSGRHFCPIIKLDLMKKASAHSRTGSREMSMEAGPSKAGVGITLKANSEGDFVVEKVLSGGGASLEQVIKGDVLRAVDGVPIAGRSLNEAQDLLTGVAGTFVQLHLDRPKLKSTYQAQIQRVSLQEGSGKGGIGGVLKGLVASPFRIGIASNRDAQ